MRQDGPPPDCSLCPRLAEFREQNRLEYPDWHNGPVPSFTSPGPRLLITGLAPGLKGANATGRPFTGDYAGDLLYSTLLEFGFASGTYGARAGDGLALNDCAITNAVRCVPPKNKPVAAEIRQCRKFLVTEIEESSSLRIILALGRIAHESVISAFSQRRADFPFGHGASHKMPGKLMLFDSYHCSRYNTNTRRLSEAMFHEVFAQIKDVLDS